MQSIDQNPFCWVEELLYEWGKWRPLNRAENGFKPKANFAITTSKCGPNISDDDGVRIDSIVSFLKNDAEILHDLAVLIFVNGLSCVQAGFALRVGQTKVKVLRQQLLAYVAAKFAK